MKIEADISFYNPIGNTYGCIVNIDKDYVESNADEVKEYVREVLEKQFGQTFYDEDFAITNLKAVLEDLTSSKSMPST